MTELEIDPAEHRTLLRAGARAVRFDAPLGETRATKLVDAISATAPDTVVDLGCGRGELLLRTLAASPTSRGIGLDVDRELLEDASDRAKARGVHDRVRFVPADAATWNEPADLAICVGTAHAFGGAGSAFAHLRNVIGAQHALVGERCWVAPPDEWSWDTFGDLPIGLPELLGLATVSRWRVVDAAMSTITEWDDYETDWRAGLTAVGTDTARELATERRSEYECGYRGVLGFGWLLLERLSDV